MEKKVIYYEDELNDEFSTAKITPIKIDKNYKYRRSFLWEIFSYIFQNALSMPIKLFYAKTKLDLKYVGKEKFTQYKDKGYFIYANHTQEFADVFIPSLANYPKRNFYIVNPENISMKGLKNCVELLGAIPVPGDIKSTKNFLSIIKYRIKKNESITIYPEAHIWPYYTDIRPFKDVSFKYPVELDAPVYVLTNTYHKGKKDGKVKIISYIDGPYFKRDDLNNKDAQIELRNRVYETMKNRSKNSDYEHIKYIKKETVEI